MANNELTWMERNNLTPGKIGLIAVLSVVFVGVVAYQLIPVVCRGAPAPPPVTAENPAAKPQARNAQIPPPPPGKAAVKDSPSSAAAIAKRTDTVWPKIELTEAVKHDPFRTPSTLREALLRQQQLAAQQANDQPEQADNAHEEAFRRREELLDQLAEQGVDVVILDGDRAVASIGGLELRVGDTFEGLLVKSISRDGIELVRVDTPSGQGEPKP